MEKLLNYLNGRSPKEWRKFAPITIEVVDDIWKILRIDESIFAVYELLDKKGEVIKSILEDFLNLYWEDRQILEELHELITEITEHYGNRRN